MISALIAYDAAGNVIATLDHLVARGEDGEVIGLVDFEAHEAADGRLRDIWEVSEAAGSGTWPEWLGPRVHDFTVELDGKRITALVHKTSGHRRERAKVEAAMAKVKPDEKGHKDIRHLVGGPGKPLLLDDRGRTLERPKAAPPRLPVIRSARPDPHE